MPAGRKTGRTTWLVLSLGFMVLVAAMAIPNIKLARMTANEASARRSLRIVNSAETKFAELHHGDEYACSLVALGEANLIPTSLASGEQMGYVFKLSDCEAPLASQGYRVSAQPAMKNQTGYWVFCSDQTGTVKGSPESIEDCFVNGVIQH
jgi:hypothetical protein